MEHQSDGISWLIDRIVTDPRTESIYRVDGTGATQLWVLTQDEHANAKVQYDYSGYLIESMDKFGFFDCDVILISNKMIANLRSGVRPRPQCCGKHFGIGAAIPGYQPLEAHDFSRGSSHRDSMFPERVCGVFKKRWRSVMGGIASPFAVIREV